MPEWTDGLVDFLARFDAYAAEHLTEHHRNGCADLPDQNLAFGPRYSVRGFDLPLSVFRGEGVVLWSLVRAFEPVRIVETYTGTGVAACFMAVACHQNGGGFVDTVDDFREGGLSQEFGWVDDPVGKMTDDGKPGRWWDDSRVGSINFLRLCEKVIAPLAQDGVLYCETIGDGGGKSLLEEPFIQAGHVRFVRGPLERVMTHEPVDLQFADGQHPPAFKARVTVHHDEPSVPERGFMVPGSSLMVVETQTMWDLDKARHAVTRAVRWCEEHPA